MTLRHKTVMGDSGWNPTFQMASATPPHRQGCRYRVRQNCFGILFMTFMSWLTSSLYCHTDILSNAWKVVLLRALRDYCRIRWDNACKVQQVPIVASAPQNRMVITLTTSLSSLHLPHSLPGPLSSSATRLILDVWLFTENQRPGWLFWLQGQSCPSTYYIIFQHHGVMARQPSKQTWKCLKSDCTVPLWDPSPESSRPQAHRHSCHLILGLFTPLSPLKPSEQRM